MIKTKTIKKKKITTQSSIKSEAKSTKQSMTFVGTWHITEMELWDEKAFNSYQRAYVTIKQNGKGEFAFCVVEAYMDGEVVNYGDEKRWEFTFEGNDEYDPVSGKGWVKLKDANSIEGKIKFHDDDNSKFCAVRSKKE